MTLELALDALLALALVGLAWRALWSDDLFTGVVLYIAFGLLMAIVWVRLAAPDIALAEAAVGAGVTGALLLDAIGELRERGRSGEPPPSALPALLTTVPLLLLAGVLGAAVLSLADAPAGVAREVAAAAPALASEHPVTAVLLELRGYDTWLETAVLLVAALGVVVVRGGSGLAGGERVGEQRADGARAGGGAPSRGSAPANVEPMLAALLRLLVPLLVLGAGYLLWLGTHAPGGAFQGGALLGAAGILLAVAGGWRGVVGRPAFLRAGLLAGLLAFTAVAAGGLLAGGRLLELPVAAAKVVLVLLEVAIAVSVGITLVVLFVGARAPERDAP